MGLLRGLNRKKRLSMVERSNTYLTHVRGLSQSIGNLEKVGTFSCTVAYQL